MPVTQRDSDFLASAASSLLPQYAELAERWRTTWESTTGLPVPGDIPSIFRAALHDGPASAEKIQAKVASQLLADEVPLDQVLQAVLMFADVVAARLARTSPSDVLPGISSINRLGAGLVMAVSDGHSSHVRRQRDDLRRGREEADRLKTELISMISHDLKTPLTTIAGCAESLLNAADIDADQRRRFLELIHKNTDRLTRLITRIVDLSRIESRAIELEVQSLDVSAQVRKVLSAMMPGASVTIEVDEQTPKIRADRDALDRILVNLVDNAIRYSPGDEKVNLVASRDGAFVEIRVVDHGPGIPADRRGGLFSKFYQVDPSPSGMRGGSGLGLAIVRGLAEAMGGDAGYLPGQGAGSIFWVRLPAAEDGQK